MHEVLIHDLLDLYVRSEMIVIGEFSGDTLASYRRLRTQVEPYIGVVTTLPPAYVDLLERIEEREEWE